jgi:hypothetical protein
VYASFLGLQRVDGHERPKAPQELRDTIDTRQEVAIDIGIAHLVRLVEKTRRRQLRLEDIHPSLAEAAPEFTAELSVSKCAGCCNASAVRVSF